MLIVTQGKQRTSMFWSGDLLQLVVQLTTVVSIVLPVCSGMIGRTIVSTVKIPVYSSESPHTTCNTPYSYPFLCSTETLIREDIIRAGTFQGCTCDMTSCL